MSTTALTPAHKLAELMKKSWRYVPIVAVYRALRSTNRRQWKIFLTTFFLTMFISNGFAMAADGTGITSLMPMQDFSNGGAKTLVEDIPASRYSLDFTEGGITNPIITTMNGLASTLMLTVAEIGWGVVVIMSWLLGSAGLFTDSLDISPMLGAAATETMGWLFPSALALGAIFTYVDYLKDKGKAFNGLMTLIVTAVAAISLALFPQAWIKGIETARAAGNQLVIAVSDASGASSDEPFEYNAISFSGNNETQAFTRQASDAVWRSMVVVPWCMAEFGSVETCQTHGKEILSKDKTEDRESYVKKNVLKEVGEDTEAGQFISGKAWSNRLGTTLIACIITLFLAILIASLVIGALLAFVQVLFLLLLGLLFLPLGMIPGITRQWASSWATMTAGALGANIVSMLLLSVSVAFITLVSQSGLVWGMQFLLMLAILFAAFSLKQVIGNIVGAQNADSGGGLSRTLSRVVKTMAMRQMFKTVRGSGKSGGNSRAINNTSNHSRYGQSNAKSGSGGQSSWRDRQRTSTVSNRLNTAQRQHSNSVPSSSRLQRFNGATAHGGNQQAAAVHASAQPENSRVRRDNPSAVRASNNRANATATAAAHVPGEQAACRSSATTVPTSSVRRDRAPYRSVRAENAPSSSPRAATPNRQTSGNEQRPTGATTAPRRNSAPQRVEQGQSTPRITNAGQQYKAATETCPAVTPRSENARSGQGQQRLQRSPRPAPQPTIQHGLRTSTPPSQRKRYLPQNTEAPRLSQHRRRHALPGYNA